jgi:hypothetical protein
MRFPPDRFPVIAVASLFLLFSLADVTVARGAEDTARAGHEPLALGTTLDERTPVSAVHGSDLVGFRLRLVARWSEIESTVGRYDWTAVERAIAPFDESGAEIVLSLTGTHPQHVSGGGFPSPLDEGSVEGWIAFVRDAVRRFAGRIEAIEVWSGSPDTPASSIDADDYAYVLKSTALAARAEAQQRGAELRIAQIPVSAGELDWQRALWERDVAAYIDILPLDLVTGRTDAGGVKQLLANVMAENLRHPPAADVWAYLRAGAGIGDWAAVADAVRSLGAGVPVALVRFEHDGEDADAVGRWLAGTHRILRDGYAPAPLGPLQFQDPEGRVLGAARGLAAFLEDETFTTLVFYWAPGRPEAFPQDRMILGTRFVRNARLVDPSTGAVLRVGSTPVEGEPSGSAVRIARAPYPGLVMFERPAADLPPEEIESSRGRELTAEEIIARYQQVREIQTDRLDRWMATGRIDLHFRFVQGGSTIDVSVDTFYFWERGRDLEWEERDYYINGNLVPWKNFPKIPLIQPEKVITLPLDLTLDKTYVYRRVGVDRVAGREAYVLEFRPTSGADGRSLYRGRVWIDTTDFHRLKASLTQTEMESPILSNEETDLFAPRFGPEGQEYYLLDRIEGTQVWNTAGRNFTVQREVTFFEYRINPPVEEFQSRRKEAYASDNNIVRDTDEGFRYLEREADGTRTLKPLDTSQWFAAVGAFQSSATDGVQPFGGVNYFDFDLFGKNVQINALIGGVVNFVTLSKPDLAGGKLSLTGDLFVSALYFNDRVFFDGDELVAQRIDERSQSLNLRLGWIVSPFVKFNLIGTVGYNQYTDDEDGQQAIADYNQATGEQLAFLLPPDHTDTAATLELEFARRAYSVVARFTHVTRSDWGEWGLVDTSNGGFVSYDPATGTYVPGPPPPVYTDFRRWGADAFKEWYLPHFQKVRVEANYLDGSNLDRFSQYRFTLFGNDRLSGFAGTGVRFDTGLIGRAGYSFNLFEVIRLDGIVENAWIRNPGSFDGTQSHTGAGLATNFVAPWKLVISASYGRVIASDVPELIGSDEFFLLILRLF